MAPGGYAWWYLDALSDDGRHGLTAIAFLGSVFSPYYAWARRQAPGGRADPLNHCALNVVQYGCGDQARQRASHRWAMTERGRADVQRDARHLRIGPSALQWDGDVLTLHIDEITVPWPRRLRGTVRVHAPRCVHHTQWLAPGHRWSPIAPVARVEVELGGVPWSGSGYLDANHGDAPLEQAFTRWDWTRAHLAEGHSAVMYDVERRSGKPLQLGLHFDANGAARQLDALQAHNLPSTGWRVPRHARSDPGAPVRVLQTLTDAPFYARSLLQTQWLGQPVTAMHESLSLTRFDTALVRALLPFRMPRVAG